MQVVDLHLKVHPIIVQSNVCFFKMKLDCLTFWCFKKRIWLRTSKGCFYLYPVETIKEFLCNYRQPYPVETIKELLCNYGGSKGGARDACLPPPPGGPKSFHFHSESTNLKLFWLHIVTLGKSIAFRYFTFTATLVLYWKKTATLFPTWPMKITMAAVTTPNHKNLI